MTLALLILDDEPEVRDALERDLIDLTGVLRIEVAESVEDAWGVIDDIDRDGDELAVALCDHRMPGTTGVEFLVEMMGDERTRAARKVLVTGRPISPTRSGPSTKPISITTWRSRGLPRS